MFNNFGSEIEVCFELIPTKTLAYNKKYFEH